MTFQSRSTGRAPTARRRAKWRIPHRAGQCSRRNPRYAECPHFARRRRCARRAPELLLDPLVAAIDVVDAVDRRRRPRPPARPAPGSPTRAGRSPSPARRSAARTPRMIAVLPSSRMSAPRRRISSMCMKRFSKIVSMIVPTPSATRIERRELRLHVGRERRVRRGAHVAPPSAAAAHVHARSSCRRRSIVAPASRSLASTASR